MRQTCVPFTAYSSDSCCAFLTLQRSLQHEKFETCRFELQQLLAQPSLTGVPLLVLGNKNDIDGHASVNEIIQALCACLILSACRDFIYHIVTDN